MDERETPEVVAEPLSAPAVGEAVPPPPAEAPAPPVRRRPRRQRLLPPSEWSAWDDEKLLELRLCDLDLTIEGSGLEESLTVLDGELAARGLLFRPHYWLSDEWFTPDGVPGIAIPFYLAHSRLSKLESHQMFEVEGGTHDWRMKILRHEAGHAIENAFHLRRRPRRKELFGSTRVPYPEFYSPRPYSKSFVIHLDAWYAQSHPDEDFAETFAVWLNPDSKWRERYHGWPAFKKLEYMDELMTRLAGRKPSVERQDRVDPLSSIRKTLKQHYDQKRAHYGVNRPEFYDRDLRRLFSDSPQHAHQPTAASFLSRYRREIRLLVARWTNEYQYTIDQVLGDMITRSRELGLRLATAPEQAKREFAVLLTVQTMNYLHSGRHRVALSSRKPLRIVVLVHESLVPPAEAKPEEVEGAAWRTEYDVVRCLTELGHEVHALGVGGELNPIRRAVREHRPHLFFNLLEGFDDVPHWDQNVVAWLELQKMNYTGCNARGLMLGRDKALTKKLLTFHRIRVAEFGVAPRGKVFRRPKKLAFPLFVKSLTFDASIGISQASVVENDEKLQERIRFIHESIGTDALVESYIEGRELYVGVVGNARLTALPIWELSFEKMPEAARKIATERLKWSLTYQKKHGIVSGPARELPEALAIRILKLCKRVYSILCLSGYARIDLRLTPSGEVYVIEANPNPQIARGEDFAESARVAGIDYGPLLSRIVNLGLDWEPSRGF